MDGGHPGVVPAPAAPAAARTALLHAALGTDGDLSAGADEARGEEARRQEECREEAGREEEGRSSEEEGRPAPEGQGPEAREEGGEALREEAGPAEAGAEESGSSEAGEEGGAEAGPALTISRPAESGRPGTLRGASRTRRGRHGFRVFGMTALFLAAAAASSCGGATAPGAPADFSGTWIGSSDLTQQGQGSAAATVALTLKLTQQGTALSGSYDEVITSSYTERGTVTGSVSGGTAHLSVVLQVCPGTLNGTATLAADRVQGTLAGDDCAQAGVSPNHIETFDLHR